MRFILYPAFGLLVLAGYGASAASPGKVKTTVAVERHTVGGGAATIQGPAAGVVGSAGAVPIWRSRFHGPAIYRPPAPRTRGGGSYYGGSSWGK